MVKRRKQFLIGMSMGIEVINEMRETGINMEKEIKIKEEDLQRQWDKGKG